MPVTAGFISCVAPHHTHSHRSLSLASSLCLTLKRIMLGCLISTVISWCKTYYCIGSAQQAGQPPPEWSLSSWSRVCALCKWQLFQPLCPGASWHQRFGNTESPSLTRPAQYIVQMWSADGGCCLLTGRVVNILSSVYRVPMLKPEKTACYANGPLT